MYLATHCNIGSKTACRPLASITFNLCADFNTGTRQVRKLLSNLLTQCRTASHAHVDRFLLQSFLLWWHKNQPCYSLQQLKSALFLQTRSIKRYNTARKSKKQRDTYLQLLHYYYIHLTPFFSRTTCVSRHQKGKPFWILMKQEMMGWQWHQLDHMQIICTLLQT